MATGLSTLKAPFPYYGGKRRWAAIVWERLGDPRAYAEPFAGSMAVLLARPKTNHPKPREVVVDIDHHVVNFFRATKADPHAVAAWCVHPTFHADLTARHRWLVQWGLEHRKRFQEDPEFYDAKAAGWWAWGLSLWIGGGWCAGSANSEKRPHIKMDGTDQGVAALGKRESTNEVGNEVLGESLGQQTEISDKDGVRGVKALGRRPHIKMDGTDQGVAALGKRPSIDRRGSDTRGVALGKRPRIDPKASSARGVDALGKRPHIDAKSGIEVHIHAKTGTGSMGVAALQGVSISDDLLDLMVRISERLRNVIVLCGNWRSALTPCPLMQAPTSPKGITVGVFLDPPYVLGDRSDNIYVTDQTGESTSFAREAWEWAVKHGEKYRIAYCSHEGDFELPDGWTMETMSFAGINDKARRSVKQECIMFSPACETKSEQPDLFAVS